VLGRVAVLCQGTVGARRVVEAVAADPDPGYEDGDLVTDHWVLSDLYYGAYYDSCCENGYSEVEIQRRSDGRNVNSVSCLIDDHNPCGRPLVASEGGTLCWTDETPTTPSTTEVVVQKAGGPPGESTSRWAPEVLDTGVVRGSLKLDGSALSWVKDDGTQRTAEVE
jgi:hypothetical protein